MTLERGDVAKIVISALLLLFLIFVCTQIYTYHAKAAAARATYGAAQTKLQTTESDHDKLEREYKYYLNPLNLAKELKARFNYQDPGEKSLILVPASTSTGN
jgi:hypothetical protein